MTLRRLRTLVSRFHRAESGAALTEFTFFLPIWIVVFIGIVNLGSHGLFSTKVQLQAQKELWDKVIQVTEGFEGQHMSPIIAGGAAAGEYFNVAGISGNDQAGNDGIEGGVQLAMITYGHYGESAEKAAIPMYPFLPDSVQGVYEPTEVLGQDDQSRYPHKLLNDTLDQDWGGSSFTSILSSLIAASGFVHSTGAGIRYGSVFTNKTETGTLLGGAADYTVGAHYDVLVAPRAITGAEAEVVPFGIAFLLFKLDDKYQEYLMFGDENWGGDFGAADTPDSSEWEDAQDEADEDIDEQCDSVCDSWDPDAENPGPKPQHWDRCGC